MSTSITTSQTFQERMFERVREQMGDLLTDDDLKKIVDSAIQKAFFEERTVKAGYGPDQTRPSFFVEMMQEELRHRVRAAADQWIKENPEVLSQAIDKVIKDGIFRAFVEALESRMNWPLRDFADQLKAKGIFT